jgi:hypothetical protein
MSTQNLLVELFVEELPPKALKKLGEAFAAALAESLVARGWPRRSSNGDELRLAASSCRAHRKRRWHAQPTSRCRPS